MISYDQMVGFPADFLRIVVIQFVGEKNCETVFLYLIFQFSASFFYKACFYTFSILHTWKSYSSPKARSHYLPLAAVHKAPKDTA